jgi:hypothetical protein
MTAGVRLEGVSKRFGPVEAVRELTLDVREGEFFSLLGPSGAGRRPRCVSSPASRSPPPGASSWAVRTLGEGWDYLLARVAVDYRRELRLEDDEVLARCGVAGVGTSSVTTRKELLTVAGELAAEAEAVVVARDPASGRPRPLSAEERATLTREA